MNTTLIHITGSTVISKCFCLESRSSQFPEVRQKSNRNKNDYFQQCKLITGDISTFIWPLLVWHQPQPHNLRQGHRKAFIKVQPQFRWNFYLFYLLASRTRVNFSKHVQKSVVIGPTRLTKTFWKTFHRTHSIYFDLIFIWMNLNLQLKMHETVVVKMKLLTLKKQDKQLRFHSEMDMH